MTPHATGQGTFVHRCASLLIHCELIIGPKEQNWCARADLHLKEKAAQTENDLSIISPESSHEREKPQPVTKGPLFNVWPSLILLRNNKARRDHEGREI